PHHPGVCSEHAPSSTSTHTHAHTRSHTRSSTHTLTHTSSHTHTHTCTQTHTHTHTHTRHAHTGYRCSNWPFIQNLVVYVLHIKVPSFTFTFSHLADAFVQSDVQWREQSS